MNACIRAVVRAAHHFEIEVIGIQNGYHGLCTGEFRTLARQDVSHIIHRGGTILGTARSKEFRTEEGRAQAYFNMQRIGIQGLVVIGGDGTYAGAHQFLVEYPDLRIVGCPGTIDNDLFGTDFTLGYDTAVNTAMEAIDKLRDTANSLSRIFFVEVMGRDAGFIALRTAIAVGAEAVEMPETLTDVPSLAARLKASRAGKKHSAIVVISEGDESGGAFAVAKDIEKLLPGYDMRVSILGHIQRGGSPTARDRVLGSRLGAAAVEALRNGENGIALGEVHKSLAKTPFERASKHNQSLNPELLALVDILQ